MKKLLLILHLCFLFTIQASGDCNPALTYYLGPKGGCYYFTASSKKQYVAKSCCGVIDSSYIRMNKDKPCGTYNDKILYKGSKGGCYTIGKNGRRNYVQRNRCLKCAA